MPKALTAAAVRALKPDPRKVRREVADGGAPGLHLVIQPSGAKSWAMRFRRPGGRPGKLTLGPVDLSGKETEAEPVPGAPLTLAGARSLAAEVQRQRALGRDVIADWHHEKLRREAALAHTFAAAARSFVEQHARPKTRRWRETARLLGLEPSDLTIISRGLADRWRDKPVAAIGGNEVHALLEEVRRRGAPGLPRRSTGATESRARAMYATLSKFFSWLMKDCRIVEKNPCTVVQRPAASKERERVLSDAELRWFWSATHEIDEPFGALLQLLAITGQRENEVARMERAELAPEGDIWIIPGTRTKNKRTHVVPLPTLARTKIALVKQIEGCKFVFSTTGSTPVSGFSKIKARLNEKMLAAARRETVAAGCDPDAVTILPWTLHDLRRTMRSGLSRLRVDGEVAEAVINHAKPGLRRIYDRYDLLDEKRDALGRWANLLTDIVDRPRGTSVARMEARR
jgi:integrase